MSAYSFTKFVQSLIHSLRRQMYLHMMCAVACFGRRPLHQYISLRSSQWCSKTNGSQPLSRVSRCLLPGLFISHTCRLTLYPLTFLLMTCACTMCAWLSKTCEHGGKIGQPILDWLPMCSGDSRTQPMQRQYEQPYELAVFAASLLQPVHLTCQRIDLCAVDATWPTYRERAQCAHC